MHIWNPQFFKDKLLFDAIVQPWQQQLQNFSEWPTLNDYNRWLEVANKPAISAAGRPIRFVSQADKPNDFVAQYEPRIYLQGEVQSREQNWHDFFNALAWANFPKLKAALNAMQYSAIKQRWNISNLRAPIENALTLFDEGGAIIFSSDDNLIELLQNFYWQELLYTRRGEFLEKMRVIIFGHALYEKALNPYVGITGNAVVIKVAADFIQLTIRQQIEKLDSFLADRFMDSAWVLTMHPFQPLPILGVPGWHAANNHASFYTNHDYFRVKGKRKNISIIEFSN